MWDALTTPRHVLRWWGPSWCPLVSCEIDLRPGGRWRYVARGDDGVELAWSGEYRAVDHGERIVATEVFEPHPDAVAVTTMTLTEADGVTTLTTLVSHSSRENRDAHVDSGMEAGMQGTFDRLDDLLAAASTPADADPVGAWEALHATVTGLLADPEVCARKFDAGPPGTLTVEQVIDRLVTGDVLVHTWDLARATGLDESIDQTTAAELLAGLEPMDEMLRASGQFGPRVPVSDDADVQTRLLAFTGRHP